LWQRKAVFEMRLSIYKKSGKLPNRKTMPRVLLAAVKELGANNPKIGEILGTSGNRMHGWQRLHGGQHHWLFQSRLY
jgi:hypothetical protein